MKYFNAFQLVSLFACLPFLCVWLSGQQESWAKPLIFILSIVYLIGFVLMTALVGEQLGNDK